jgi:hypothetical protein
MFVPTVYTDLDLLKSTGIAADVRWNELTQTWFSTIVVKLLDDDGSTPHDRYWVADGLDDSSEPGDVMRAIRAAYGQVGDVRPIAALLAFFWRLDQSRKCECGCRCVCRKKAKR